ncbi:MAG TPA: sigma 54-interacting transcriptional regulator [Pyrinomonadaceae bacterium]|jgi:transcriptional regulator with GAF, ATPase, and Fis domain/Tfp pilus assembly protein PilF
MNRRTRTPGNQTIKDAPAREAGVVDLASARLHSRKAATRESLAGELEEIRLLLDQGRSTEVQSRITPLIVAARQDASLLAQARCALSMALEMQGRYKESLEAVRMYETPETRARVDAETITRLNVQIGLAYNYTGDHPKAIALLNSALRESSDDGSDTQMGAIYVALARIYRSINEHPIARDYAQRALEHYRNSGDWRGLAESYFGIALADMLEGNYEAALDNYEQALNLVGDYPAPYLLAKIYNNMAGACWFLKRPQEGIRNLEKSISYYERTEHKANATDGYNNLGINFILVGDWTRAQAALERALALASEVHANSPKLSMPLDSLGELYMLRGDLLMAQGYLERAVAVATEHNHKWYAGQAIRTMGRCLLAMNNAAGAREHGRQALGFANAIGDRQAICESRLLLAEADLMCGDLEECAAELEKVAEQTTDSVTDLGFAGEAQRMQGLLAIAHEDVTLASQHFSRSVTIFDILGDRYRGARAHYELGRAYASASPERAAEHLSRAAHTFRELGARLDLARAEEALAALDRNAPQLHDERSALTQLLTLRLAEAVASRELLLRELAAVIYQETDAQRVLVLEPGEDNQTRVVVAHGCTPEQATRSAEEVGLAQDQDVREQLSSKHDALLIPLRATNAAPALLFIAPRASAMLPGGIAIEPLLRIVELGMNVCALRAGAQSGRAHQEDGALAGTSLMPGFIHSSPAMTRLVEEVHKIRSSDVTVLVTGESGTGKELVARAIHAISSRRAKVFVPFNCTAVPKELSEGYLFGYRRGSFTGAVHDSPGVIRAAEGGTLFLDEIGDLPLDVQPKLLRFLQEGEIQPLGEQRPVKVDVRIIAATNTDLEEMVAGGRFREDLYYRLNVIRLRVPPLRERRSEIPTIVNYYINHYSAKFGRRDIEITPQAVDLLMVCDWPGNVRQLTNEIQRIVARAEDGTLITPDHLSPELRRTSTVITPPALVTPINAASAPPEGTTLADALAELERRMIAEAMRKHGGNISRAARELGLTRRGLYLKLERHDMSASA